MTSRKPARKTAAKRPARRAAAPQPVADVVVDIVPIERGHGASVGRQLDELLDERNAHSAAVLSIRQANRALDRSERELRGAVLAARHLRVSWREIGIAAGMTGRGAQKRWGEPPV